MKETEMSEDARLIERVRNASKAKIDPTTIEEQIQQKALVNTATGFPLEALRRVDLGADPDHPDETLNLDSAKTVIYWARPTEASDPQVVGLQIDGEGNASTFFAVVYPP